MNMLEKQYRELVKHLGTVIQRLNGKNSRKSKGILYSLYNKHSDYLDKIEKTKSLLEDKFPDEKIDPVEETYELYKDIIEHLMVTDQTGNKIEDLHHSAIYSPDREVLMDYYNIQGTVENLGGDVIIHATIDEIINFFKGRI